MTSIAISQLDPGRFDTPAILKKLTGASRQLAELKGVASAIPNQSILINSLGLQEAKDSSAVENIVTTHDELFRDSLFPEDGGSPAAKEVLRYRQALGVGFEVVREQKLLTTNHILEIQRELERNNAGFRRVPGTVLRDQNGNVVFTPPETDRIPALMGDLDRFVNDEALFGERLSTVNGPATRTAYKFYRAPGMSFHKLDKVKDRNFWSVRVNRDIRVIVHRMPGSLMLCYVDHHDKAYAWAESSSPAATTGWSSRRPWCGTLQDANIRSFISTCCIQTTDQRDRVARFVDNTARRGALPKRRRCTTQSTTAA